MSTCLEEKINLYLGLDNNIPREDRIRFIREYKDFFGYREWAFYSSKFDWTIDEIREFQDYIDWHCYYVYCSRKQLTFKQLLEFKEKHRDWVLIFEYRYVGEEILRKFVSIIDLLGISWKYIFKKNKVSDKFREEYSYLLEKDKLYNFDHVEKT